MNKKNNMKKIIYSLIFVLYLLSGCGIQFSNLKQEDSFSGDQLESIVILSVTPKARISFFEGKEINGQWECASIFNVANIESKDGFVVLKLKPRADDSNYGIGQILPNGLLGASFIVKKGTTLPVFNTMPGTITYAGAFKYIATKDGARVEINDSITIEDAKVYIMENYPKLQDDIIEKPLKMLDATAGC